MKPPQTICGAMILTTMCAASGAQETRSPGPVYRSGVEMVALTVTVTDAAGRSVTGLSERDFAVHEEGVPQTLSLFGAHEVPADVALVLDTSASMGVDLPRVKRAAQGLVGQLRADDRAAVVAVKDVIEMPQPLTADHAQAIAALNRLRATGSTAMYDGLYTALRDFERSRRNNPGTRRQALVLLSDGFDNSSHMTLDDVSELARRLDVTIYTVTLRNGKQALPRRGVDQSDEELNANYAMRSLARDTGGLAFFPMGAGELEAIYEAIGRELISQYSLGYVPAGATGSQPFRRVSVRVLPPAQGTARTRSGYLARGAAARPRGRLSNDPASER